MLKGKVNDISSLINQVVLHYQRMQESMRTISMISNKSKMLSLNSSIEAARLGAAGRGFSVIANNMQNFTEMSEKANMENQNNIQELISGINVVVGVRTADVAFDLIDKIDRNLFERNCDVQAWATFETILEYGRDPSSSELMNKVNDLLFNLYKIYEVYYDVFMTDANGTIIAAANRREHIGEDAGHTEWFQNAIGAEGCYVEDMHHSALIGDYAVSYSCRIMESDGTVLGVLSTRFNWKYIYDILNQSKISKQGEVYLVNEKGIIIASRDPDEVLKENIMKKYPVVKNIIEGELYSYFMDIDSNNKLNAVLGCAHTQGYNNYAGKNWSVIVKENIN